jgi:HK97 gp10 family phage protein
MISIDVKRTRSAPDISGRVRQAAARVMEDGAADVVREARARVITNKEAGGSSPLAGSIDAQQGRDALEWTVRADAPYARFVELGTRRMAARPFLMPALRFVWPRISAGIRTMFKGEAA